MMFTATPLRNPVRTDTETKRVKRPQRSAPAPIIITPASADSTNSASGRSALEKSPNAEPAANAAAVVVVTTISRVLTATPPPIGPAMLAYSPYTGLTPTSTAEAIPSGTLAIAPGTPATRSCRSVRRSGRSEASHPASRFKRRLPNRRRLAQLGASMSAWSTARRVRSGPHGEP